MLRQVKDLSAVAFGSSMSILTIFYSIIISECILRSGARRIERELEKRNEKYYHIWLISETFAKRSILFKAKKGEKFNHPSTICRTYGAGRNTLSVLRIKI